MTTVPRSQPQPARTGIFSDPWNEPASTAEKVRTTIAFVIFVALVILFASTASAWVSSLSPQDGFRPAADAPKANGPEGAARSPVLVLAPRGMTPAQAEEFAARLRATPDGYFSRVTYGAYDVIVNGSIRRSGAGDAPIRMSETETGRAAMFARAGGEYQVEFVCRGPGAEEGVSCISEADAFALVTTLSAFDGEVS